MRKIYLLAVLAMVMLASCSKDDDVAPANGELTFVEDYQRSYNRIEDNISLRVNGIDTTTTATAFDAQLAELKILVAELEQLKAVVRDRRLSNDFHEDERNRLIALHGVILELEHELSKRMHMYAELKDGKEEVFFTFNALTKERHNQEGYSIDKAEEITAKMAFLKENNYKELAIFAQMHNASFDMLESFVADYYNIALVDQVAILVNSNVFETCNASDFIVTYADQIASAYAAIDKVIAYDEREDIYNNYLRPKYALGIRYSTIDNYAKNIVKVSQFITDFRMVEEEVGTLFTKHVTEGQAITEEAKNRTNELAEVRSELFASLSWGDLKFTHNNQYCDAYFGNVFAELDPNNSNNNNRTIGKLNTLRKL